jgi:hypothetical protein
MISRKARAVAVLVQAAPVLLGVPLYVAAFSLAGMLVFFFPGVFMVIAGLVVAVIARLLAPPGFVRTEAAGSLRFHGIVAIVALAVLALVFVAVFAGGYMGAASSGAILLGVLLPLVETVRSLMYGVAAARGSYPPPVPAP